MTTLALQPSIFGLNEKSKSGVLNLISNSHDKPMDLNTVVPWSKGVDRNLLPKKAEHCWLYGTPHFDDLTKEQLNEVLWLENARDVSMFITLEQTIPPLYMGFINSNPGRLSPEVEEYCMIFSKEEIVHSLVFKRYLKLAKLPMFSPPANLQEMLLVHVPKMHPVAGILTTLIVEWGAELSAMYSSQTDDIEPFTREMNYQHHIDESRHIAFGRWVGESFFEKASEQDAKLVRDQCQLVMKHFIPQFTYNPEIAKFTSFKFPIAVDDIEQIELVRNSPTNTARNEKRFAPLYAWLKKLEIKV